jgi:K+ transporter
VGGLQMDTDTTSFFYADPTLVRAADHPLPTWQRRYFRVIARNAHPLSDDLGIKPARLVELGVEVAI